MIASDIRGWMGPRFSWYLSYGWGKAPEKKFNQENWPNRGSNTGPLGERQRWHLSTISVVSYYILILNRPCDGASGVVGRYPCYSQTFNKGDSSQPILRPGSMSDTSWGNLAQAVRRSPPTSGVPCSRLGYSMSVSWWTKRSLGRFSRGFSRFTLQHISFQHSSILIHLVLLHFTTPVMV